MLRFFEAHNFKARLLPEVVVRMDPDGFSSSWRNRFRGYQDIKLAFKENNCTPEKFYFIKRYGKKFFERNVQKFTISHVICSLRQVRKTKEGFL